MRLTGQALEDSLAADAKWAVATALLLWASAIPMAGWQWQWSLLLAALAIAMACLQLQRD